MRLLVTGGAGFIGCNFVRYMLENHNHEIVVLDKLTYSGRKENLQDLWDRITFVKGDICVKEDVERAIKACDAVVNFAAESHVDRSITTPEPFIRTDVLGTFNLLEAARRHEIERFLQISTDEVYGSIENGSFKEDDMLDPSSPYSASKAGADMLCGGYHKTYGLPVLITRSSNNFGPHQYPEKLIPLLITNALRDKPLPIYGDGKNVRDWIYVLDNCEAIDVVLQKGKFGEIYNAGAGNERQNIEIAHFIVKELKKPDSLIQFVEDRPGHDRRYSLDYTKMRGLGWKLRHGFENALKETVKWYLENEWWWKKLV